MSDMPPDPELADLDAKIHDATQWRELVSLLRGHGWLTAMITPARIARDLPWMWPYGEFREKANGDD